MKPRLLPVVIAVASIALLLKTGTVWQGLGAVVSLNTAVAQAAPADGQTTDTTAMATTDGQAKQAEAGAGDAETVAAGSSEAGGTTDPLPSDVLELSDEEIEVLQRLAARRGELEARAAELDRRGSLLEAAERRIQEKVAELEILKGEIEQLMLTKEEQEESQLASLVKIYENMKPKEAARIFEELDMIVLLDVVERMKERKVAPILARMNPQRAKEITLELARRRDLPGAAS